jgi:hypothetical protein
VDPTHFRVVTAIGIGPVKLRFKLDVELFEIVEGRALKMRTRGIAPGSAVDVLSALRLEDTATAGPGSGGPPPARSPAPWPAWGMPADSPEIHGGGVYLRPSRLAAHPRQERTMSDQNHIRIELTEEQKAQVKAATGKDARAIEFGVEELEERIAPMQRRIV